MQDAELTVGLAIESFSVRCHGAEVQRHVARIAAETGLVVDSGLAIARDVLERIIYSAEMSRHCRTHTTYLRIHCNATHERPNDTTTRLAALGARIALGVDFEGLAKHVSLRAQIITKQQNSVLASASAKRS